MSKATELTALGLWAADILSSLLRLGRELERDRLSRAGDVPEDR